MRTRSCCGWIVPVASLLLLAGTGCDDRRGDRVTVIERGHVCGPACRDHYYDGRTVVVAQRHIHGPGCGHRWDGGNWVMVTGRPVRPSGHVCTINCNHHYGHDGRVIEVDRGNRHVHGRNCGHEYDGHRWVVAGQVRHNDDHRSRRIDRDDDDRGRGRRIERDDERGRDRERDRDRDDRRGRR